MYLSEENNTEKKNKEIARLQWDSWIKDSTEDNVKYDSEQESIENAES